MRQFKTQIMKKIDKDDKMYEKYVDDELEATEW